MNLVSLFYLVNFMRWKCDSIEFTEHYKENYWAIIQNFIVKRKLLKE